MKLSEVDRKQGQSGEEEGGGPRCICFPIFRSSVLLLNRNRDNWMVMTPMALHLLGAGTVGDGYVSPEFNLESTLKRDDPL